MREPLRVLIAGANPRLADEARRCLAESHVPAAVQCLQDGAVALARLGGGDIDILVVDGESLDACGRGPGSLLERLRAVCGPARTIVVTESRDWVADLRSAVGARIRQLEAAGSGSHPGTSQRRRGPTLIGLLGAKGGVGATTVALNVAATLAGKGATVLAELGAGNDTLKLHLRTTARSAFPPGSAFCNLWSIKDVPGLVVALAQDGAVPETANGELPAMAVEAEYLVVDLGSTLTPPVKDMLSRIDVLGVVVDLEMLSVECARRMASTIGQSELLHGAIGLVVVNRAALACPFSADEVQSMVGMPVVGAIPSASDLCSAAQKARRPVVVLDPESMVAQSLVRVALSLAEMS